MSFHYSLSVEFFFDRMFFNPENELPWIDNADDLHWYWTLLPNYSNSPAKCVGWHES
jgi:hypothetical protein